MRKITFFLTMMVAMVTTSFAQTPVLELSAEQIGNYPYQLNEEDAAKVFALTDLTVAVKINTAGISGRRGLFVTSDPTQAKNTDAEGTASRYVAYGLNAENISYLASWRSGDRFSGGAKFTANSEVVCVYVINPTNGKCELYFNGALDRSWSGTNPNGFMSGYEIATPAMVKANHANANIYIGGGVSSEGASETFDGTIEGVKVYSGALSAAEIAAISFEDPTLLAEARAAFDAAQAAAQAILDEAELNVTTSEIEMQVSDENAVNYLWTNNPETSEGPITDLIDGNTNTFFHTNWHGGGETPHWIAVDLGEGSSLAEFSFSYTTRNFSGADDYPDAIEVLGCNEKDGTYTSVYTINRGLPQASNTSWGPAIVSSETAYRYYRFVVTAERTYWHMSEFDIFKNEISIAEKYAAVATEVASLKSICDAHAGNATYNIAALNAAAEAINAIVATVNAGVVTPEPEPETPATLNETVVFDFANNVWGIQEGLDPVSFAGTKTAGEYTDGTKTIYIDPTAKKGQFYYENGYLRIQKPGSKIVLPAFDFAVEKIEVVGHASATSYPSVDMNVYVGSTAVSTACIGSTETYTYEIAADNQAAGNVYELVIGSNGGDYSSVMYITYVKVYPAENKLEAPAFDLASGVYVGEQTVNVHSATTDLEGVTDVTYYYTTDGNEPTVEDEETDGEIVITESCTLKVIVEFTYGDKVYVSASSSAEYIITEEVTYHRAVAVESGSYFIVADGNVSTPINGTTLMAKETSVSGNDVTEAVYYAVTLEETENGYHIKDVNGNYIYNTMMTPHKLATGTSAPMDAWTIEIADDENSTAMIVCNGYALALQNGVFCTCPVAMIPADAILPTLYGTHATGINEAVVNGEAIESIYDLQGRMIEKVTNGGIYIVNGKKILVK